MKKRSFAVCEEDGCKNAVILDSREGAIIRGGVYTADPENPGGLIGGADAGSELAYCRKHFLEAMGWDRPTAGAVSTDALDPVVNLREMLAERESDNRSLLTQLTDLRAAHGDVLVSHGDITEQLWAKNTRITELEAEVIRLQQELEAKIQHITSLEPVEEKASKPRNSKRTAKPDVETAAAVMAEFANDVLVPPAGTTADQNDPFDF